MARKFDRYGYIERNERLDYIVNVVAISVVLPLVSGCIMLIYFIDKQAPSSVFIVRVLLVSFLIPWAIVGFGKIRVLLGQVEREIYESTGWKVDLDLDGETGEDEKPAVVPQEPVIRPIPVYLNKKSPVVQLPDGRKIGADKVSEFVVGAQGNNASWPTWKKRGWQQEEWEAVLDLLAIHGLAEERRNGVASKITATPMECKRAFGI
jgi:hypothetical protein